MTLVLPSRTRMATKDLIWGLKLPISGSTNATPLRLAPTGCFGITPLALSVTSGMAWRDRKRQGAGSRNKIGTIVIKACDLKRRAQKCRFSLPQNHLTTCRWPNTAGSSRIHWRPTQSRPFHMKSTHLLQSVFALLSIPCLCARADVVTDWNSTALNAIKVDRTSPPVAARNLAVMHVAIFDACNGIGQNCQPYFVTEKPAGVASKEAAIATAAHEVLLRLYPTQAVTFDVAYRNSLAQINDGQSKSVGIAWGKFVAEIILQLRANDGSSTMVDYTPGSEPGDWIPTPPGFAPALLPNWPFVVPFAMTSGDQFRPPPPPELSSGQWTAEFNLTKGVGSVDSVIRTAEQTEIARFWADGAGTATPAGHWNIIAREVATQRGNTLDQNARLFALLNIAEADAAILAWDCKYAFNFWRPVTAIRNADTDGNPGTSSDGAWTPLLITPNFPEYTSGHSTFSGAAATVLAVFFGANEIAFTDRSGDLPSVARSFDSFSQAAEEAGISRIYGGIHFMSANQNGLASGALLGGYVMQNLLQPKRGKSHRGH